MDKIHKLAHLKTANKIITKQGRSLVTNAKSHSAKSEVSKEPSDEVCKL